MKVIVNGNFTVICLCYSHIYVSLYKIVIPPLQLIIKYKFIDLKNKCLLNNI